MSKLSILSFNSNLCEVAVNLFNFIGYRKEIKKLNEELLDRFANQENLRTLKTKIRENIK
jgi:hypothetical protein